MERTKSSSPLQRYEYYPQRDGTALVVLNDNIVQGTEQNDDGSSYECWTADQVTVATDMTPVEVAGSFYELWALGEEQAYRRARAEMADADWREDIDAALLDIMEVMA